MSAKGMGGRISQQMENMSKQRGMGYAGNHNPIGKADEAGWFVRDKSKKEHNVALRSLLWDHKIKIRFLCSKNWFFNGKVSGKLAHIHVKHWSHKGM